MFITYAGVALSDRDVTEYRFITERFAEIIFA